MKLSKQAINVLEELQDTEELTISQFEERGYDQSMVNRAALELQEKGLIEIEEEEEESYELTEAGEEVRKEGSPEHRLLERVEEGDNRISDLQDLQIDVALGKAREHGWIQIRDGEVELLDPGEEALGEDVLKKRLGESRFKEEDVKRGLVDETTSTVRTLKITDEGYEIDAGDVELEFNVEAEAETPRVGKTHFYKDILGFAREKFMEMGFQEMSGDFVVPGLLNFDALYTPQDHPARDLQDTFFMEKPEKSDLSEYGEKVQHIKETHEDGWETGSSGWGYDWSEEDAAQNVLRTHTTAVSARRLHEIDVNEEELPKKFFIIGRNFRNETVDRTHLAGFIQLDGIVVGEDLNFKNLKAYLSEFFEKMGYSEFRLIPSYYPYTEMSVEVQVWDEEEEAWLGMGGAGLFRPEVVKPLLGYEATVLAWGLGLGRVAMKAAGLEDLRELYRNDIEILETTPKWRPKNRGEK
ncbi:MAG: phenylalanine--tRNA ligase subunit alpha [Candidatus Nanosalina sp.]